MIQRYSMLKIAKQPLILSLMAVEARKAGSWENYRKDFLLQIKRGIYYHFTDDPNFFIDPLKGPRDMSSIGGGSFTQNALMFTSDIDAWKDYGSGGKGRKYCAILDLSLAPRESYQQVSRGFGNEFFIKDAAKYVRVLKVIPRERVNSFDRNQQKYVPSSEEDLHAFYVESTK